MSASSDAPFLSGPTRSEIGVVTHEYVSSPYGVARVVLPHVPRTDGITVLQLPWGAIAYVSEDSIERIDDYREQQLMAERAAHKSLQESAKKAKQDAKASRSSSGAENKDAKPSGQEVAASSPDAAPLNAEPPVRQQSKFPAFAPLKVPLARRRQTMALAVSSFFSLFCCGVALLCIRAQGWVFYLFLAYCVWMLLFQSYHKDGKGLKWEAFRNMKWWCWFRDYFPISLHATAPLDPQRRYIFGYHPHGILSLGAFLNFGSNATGFNEKFPGIDSRLMTLTSNFRIPFYGFLLSFMGIMDASRESCNNCLQRAPGSAIVLVLGGAKESLDAHAHRDYELTLHRCGFVKVALENHADLVPVFSFGENDVWDQVDNPRGSLLRTVQEKLQQQLGFALPLVKGRGIFNYNFGLLAHRRPISTFVGAPVILPRLSKSEITDEVIRHWHDEYKKALEQLFNTYKGTFAPKRKLVFVQRPLQIRHDDDKSKRKRSDAPTSAPTSATTAGSEVAASATQTDDALAEPASTLTKRK